MTRRAWVGPIALVAAVSAHAILVRCLGTLVDPLHLLTVAHCAVDLELGHALDVGGTRRGGGPVFLDVDGEAVLVGLNSFGDGGGGGVGVGEYGAYDHQTRASRFSAWIDDALAGRDPDERRGCATVDPPVGAALLAVILVRRRRR